MPLTEPPEPTFSPAEFQGGSSDPIPEWLMEPFDAICFAQALAWASSDPSLDSDPKPLALLRELMREPNSLSAPERKPAATVLGGEVAGGEVVAVVDGGDVGFGCCAGFWVVVVVGGEVVVVVSTTVVVDAPA